MQNPIHYIAKSYIKSNKRYIVQLLLGMAAGTAFQLSLPYLAQAIVDIGIQNKDISFIRLILFTQLALFILRTSVDFIRSKILLFLSTQLNIQILDKFWKKVMSMPQTFHIKHSNGEILQRLNDYKRVEQFLTGGALSTIFSIFNIILFLLILYNYNEKIAAIFTTATIAYVSWITLFMKQRKKLDDENFKMSTKSHNSTLDLINGMSDIKIYHAEKVKQQQWSNIQKELHTLQFKTLSINQYQQAGAMFLSQGKDIIITFLISQDVVNGSLSLGAMMAILSILAMLSGPIDQILTFSQQLQEAKISGNRLNKLLSFHSDDDCLKSTFTEKKIHQQIKIKDLSYRYEGSKVEVIKNINVTIEIGKTTAIVGGSGSGKTTLMKILQKTLTGYSGEIMIQQTPLNDIGTLFWRRQYSCVMQDSHIFTGTIADNIALGQSKISPDRLIESSRIANLTTLIDELPDGFQTVIGHGGLGLSQGQKQRVLLARSVYKESTLLFLDEATNALDTINENEILTSIKTRQRDRTVIMIAHRLATVKSADSIIVMDAGEIVEIGTHEHLTNLNGRYAELFKSQTQTI